MVKLCIPAEKIEFYKDHFRLVMKRLKLLDKLGIKWLPRKWDYTGKYDTYKMEVLLPDENIVIETCVKTPRFDDGRCRFFKYSYVNKVDDDGKTLGSEVFTTLEMLFEVLKARHERGDALFQNEEYRDAHGENLYFLKYYRQWKREHGVK